jgi:hypothetical protein
MEQATLIATRSVVILALIVALRDLTCNPTDLHARRPVPPLAAGVVELDFTQLELLPAAFASGQLPESIQRWDGRRVRIFGHLLALEGEDARVSRALLARTALDCCYGQPPALYERVIIELDPPQPMPLPRLGWVSGTLHLQTTSLTVHEPVMALYRLTAERIE